MSHPKLIGIGNPLLDISAHVSKEWFTKFEVEPGSARLADPKHVPHYAELQSVYEVEYIAGGACQNSMRAAQWMAQKPKFASYIGCVGNDNNGKTLRSTAEKAGVEIHYLVDETKPTGTCAVLIQNRERGLCANLGAAEAYKMEHFQSKEIQDLLSHAELFYGEGFFITHSPNVLIELGKVAAAQNKPYFINVSAPFVVDFFWDKLKEVIPYPDGIICNEDEAHAVGKKLEWAADIEVIAKNLAGFSKVNTKRERMVIFTQGSKQTIVFSNGTVQKFHPVKIAASEIVDTNGAGDSFAGGFLAYYGQGKSLDESIAAGHYCAMECIKRSGATLPDKVNFQYSK